MKIEVGAEWEHFNASTDEVRRYTLTEIREDGRIAVFEREAGGMAYAFVRTLARQPDTKRSHWRPA